jgi:hypothetical protein
VSRLLIALVTKVEEPLGVFFLVQFGLPLLAFVKGRFSLGIHLGRAAMLRPALQSLEVFSLQVGLESAFLGHEPGKGRWYGRVYLVYAYIYIYIYEYMCMCVCVCVGVYVCMERDVGNEMMGYYVYYVCCI